MKCVCVLKCMLFVHAYIQACVCCMDGIHFMYLVACTLWLSAGSGAAAMAAAAALHVKPATPSPQQQGRQATDRPPASPGGPGKWGNGPMQLLLEEFGQPSSPDKDRSGGAKGTVPFPPGHDSKVSLQSNGLITCWPALSCACKT